MGLLTGLKVPFAKTGNLSLPGLRAGSSGDAGPSGPQIDPETEAAINKSSELASKSIAQMQAERMPEISPEDIKAQVAEGATFNKALGMATPDQLTDTLSRRAQKKYASDLGVASRLSEPGLYSKKAQALTRSQQLFARRGQIEMEIQEGLRKLEEDKKKARNSTLASILGVGGALIGGAIAGPGGAVAGSQLGKVGGESNG